MLSTKLDSCAQRGNERANAACAVDVEHETDSVMKAGGHLESTRDETLWQQLAHFRRPFELASCIARSETWKRQQKSFLGRIAHQPNRTKKNAFMVLRDRQASIVENAKNQVDQLAAKLAVNFGGNPSTGDVETDAITIDRRLSHDESHRDTQWLASCWSNNGPSVHHVLSGLVCPCGGFLNPTTNDPTSHPGRVGDDVFEHFSDSDCVSEEESDDDDDDDCVCDDERVLVARALCLAGHHVMLPHLLDFCRSAQCTQHTLCNAALSALDIASIFQDARSCLPALADIVFVQNRLSVESNTLLVKGFAEALASECTHVIEQVLSTGAADEDECGNFSDYCLYVGTAEAKDLTS